MPDSTWTWNETWGRFGSEEPCSHLRRLRIFLEDEGMSITSEHGLEPAGWVNVYCSCGRTYETVLRNRDERDVDNS